MGFMHVVFLAFSFLTLLGCGVEAGNPDPKVKGNVELFVSAAPRGFQNASRILMGIEKITVTPESGPGSVVFSAKEATDISEGEGGRIRINKLFLAPNAYKGAVVRFFEDVPALSWVGDGQSYGDADFSESEERSVDVASAFTVEPGKPHSLFLGFNFPASVRAENGGNWRFEPSAYFSPLAELFDHSGQVSDPALEWACAYAFFSPAQNRPPGATEEIISDDASCAGSVQKVPILESEYKFFSLARGYYYIFGIDAEGRRSLMEEELPIGSPN